MISKAIIKKLRDSPTITALVGSRVERNVILENIPLPAIYVNTDSMERLGVVVPESTMIGKIEIGAYAVDYNIVMNIINAIRSVLDDFNGVVNTVAVDVSRGIETTDQYDEVRSAHVKIIEYDGICETLN